MDNENYLRLKKIISNVLCDLKDYFLNSSEFDAKKFDGNEILFNIKNNNDNVKYQYTKQFQTNISFISKFIKPEILIKLKKFKSFENENYFNPDKKYYYYQNNKLINFEKLNKKKFVKKIDLEKYIKFEKFEFIKNDFIYLNNNKLFFKQEFIDFAEKFIFNNDYIFYEKNNNIYYYNLINKEKKFLLKGKLIYAIYAKNENKFFIIFEENEKIYLFFKFKNIIKKSFIKNKFKNSIIKNFYFKTKDFYFFNLEDFILKIDFEGNIQEYVKKIEEIKNCIYYEVDAFLKIITYENNTLYYYKYDYYNNKFINKIFILNSVDKNFKFFKINNYYFIFNNNKIYKFNEYFIKINEIEVSYIPLNIIDKNFNSNIYIKNNNLYINDFKILKYDFDDIWYINDYFLFLRKGNEIYKLKIYYDFAYEFKNKNIYYIEKDIYFLINDIKYPIKKYKNNLEIINKIPYIKIEETKKYFTRKIIANIKNDYLVRVYF